MINSRGYGVLDVNALQDGRVGISFDPKVADEEKIITRVREIGHSVVEASPVSADTRGRQDWQILYWTLTVLLVSSVALYLYRHVKRKTGRG